MIGRLLSVFCWTFLGSLLLCGIIMRGFETALVGLIVAGSKPNEATIITLSLIVIASTLVAILVHLEARTHISKSAAPIEAPASLEQIAI